MKLAYVVDVHDRFDAVSETLRSVGQVDVLLIGGDLTTGGTADDAERAIVSWQALVPRVFSVAGNMDSREIDTRLTKLGVSLDQAGVVVDGVGLFGVSAAPLSPLRTPYELAEAELARRIEIAFALVAGSRLRIFCPHAPPRGTTCDRLADGSHVGSEAVRRFIEREQPDLVLCGHIHEARGTDTIGRSRIVNPGPASAGRYALIETQPEPVVWLDATRSRIAF